MRSSAFVAALLVVLSGQAFAQEPPQTAAPPAAAAATDPRQPENPVGILGLDQAQAQDPQKPPAAVGEPDKKPTRGFFSALGHNLKDDAKHLPRRNTLYFLAGGGALALAVHPYDDNINKHLEGSGAARTFFRPGTIIGQTPVLLGAGVATYFIARHQKSDWVQHLGMDEIEAQLIAAGLVIALKESARRDRPVRADGTRAGGFSFPSGHATATFAGATVLQQHLGYKAGVPTYLIASYVAMSRLHDNVHNASDVVFGAALGIVVGRTVTWHGRNFYASPMLLPKGTGVIVTINTDARPSLRHP